MSRRIAAPIAALLVALVVPAAASAHAQLEGTSPQRGAVVLHEPRQVVFRFDEAVEGNFGALRVFDGRGDRVDEGDSFHPGGSAQLMAVRLERGLTDGTYTATYRVVSADGHIVSSGYTFSIGRPSAAAKSVTDLIGGERAGKVTEVAFAAARAVQYGAVGLVVGLIAFLALCWWPSLRESAGGSGGSWDAAEAAFRGRLCRVLLISALAGAVAALVGVVLEAAEAAGVSGWSALRQQTLSEVIATRFGTVWTIAAGAFLAAGLVGAAVVSRPPGPRVSPGGRLGRTPTTRLAGMAATAPATLAWAAIVASLGYLSIAPALGGHGATQPPVGVMFPSLVVHVAAMSAWFGGLVALLACLPAATRRLEGGERTRLLAATLTRFSALALVAVAALLTTGLVQSYVEVRHLGLVLTTPFGRAVLIKLIVLLGLIALGALNRRRTVPRLVAAARGGSTPGAAGILLRRTLRSEVALIAVALATTGALASYAPAIAQSQRPVNQTARVGPAEVQLAVDPAEVGANELHLYLIDPVSGAPFAKLQQLTLTATLASKGIGPLPLEAEQAGPGHYVVPRAFLTASGDWDVRVTLRTSEFDEYAREVKVPVR